MQTLHQSVHLRPICEPDLSLAMHCDRICYPLDHWPESEWRIAVRQRTTICMVADFKHGDRNAWASVGFVLFELHRRWIAIEKLAVHPEWQRCGIGKRMISHVVAKMLDASVHDRNRIEIDVRESSLDAHLFLRSMKFRAIGVRSESYPNGESAYLFERRKES